MYKKKFIISSGIMAGLLFTSLGSFATSTGVINTETVKMRSEASTDSKIVMLVSINDKVEIIEKSGDWYKVKFEGKTGYIYAEYVDNKDEKNQQSTNNVSENNTTTSGNTTVVKNNTKNEINTTTNQENKENNQEIVSENTQLIVIEDSEIRLVPLINSSVITSIKSNTTVTVLDYINGWYFISTSDIEGWIRIEKVNSVNNVSTQDNDENENKEIETEEEKTESQTETKKYVNTEKVNVRKEANTSSDIIKTITKNTEVKVISTEGNWSKVEVNGEKGYISSEYLSEKKVKETENTVSNENSNNSNTSKYNTTTNRSLETSRTEETSVATKSGAEVVSYAKTFLKTKYVLGGDSPSKGFDCSGFTAYIYKKFGVSLAHSARAQATVGTKIEKANLQEGDLVIFNNDSNTSIGHVGIYIGGNQFIHASNPSDGVKITSLSSSYYLKRYVTARRVI